MKFPDAMTTPPVPASPEKSRIPVMFSATGSWGLPLGVAIHNPLPSRQFRTLL